MFDLQKHISIDHIENLSDSDMARARIHFKNGYELSVIKGFGSYGSKEGLFEIAIMRKDGEYANELYEEGDSDVLGFLTLEKVMHYIDKTGRL